MAKKTLAEKKRADERRVALPGGAYTEAPSPIPTSEIRIAGLSLETSENAGERRAGLLNHPFLKKDLLKVGILAVGAVVLEYVLSYAIKHGALAHWGVS